MYDGFNWNFWVVQGSGGRFTVSIRNSSVVFNQISCVMFVVLPWMLMKFIFDPIRHRFFCKYKSWNLNINIFFFFLWKQTAQKVPRNSVIKCHHLFDQRLVNILCITIFWLSGCLNNQLPSTQKWKRTREIIFIYNLWKNKSFMIQNQACLAF